LRKISESTPDCTILFPYHPSPDLPKITGELENLPRLRILPPLPYPTCAHLLPRLTLLLTDSGGLQEEAAFLGIPTLVLREKSERGDAPSLKIIGSNPDQMVREAVRLLSNEGERSKLCQPSTRYGGGFAAERMADEILAFRGTFMG
jgi:UDP-N-acetylglucosamine 2-epimerase (non-hydrolysing)